MPGEPSDAMLEDARRPRPARSPLEARAADARTREFDADFGTRSRPAANPVLGLKAEINDLRKRLRAASQEAEGARLAQAARMREVEALARSLEVQLVARDTRIRNLLGSWSWRATRPMRSAHRFARLALSVLKWTAARVYRAAPLPSAAKRLMLEVLFRAGAPLFRNSNTYRAWDHARLRGVGFGRVPHEVAPLAEMAYSAAVPFAFTAPYARPRLAVLCHVYHQSIAAELAAYLGNIRFPFDLYVTTDCETKKTVIAEAFGPFAPANLRVVPNRGRDIAAKLLGFPEIYDSHEFVLHIHAKVSNHTSELAAWRGFLLENLLGSEGIVDSVFAAFDARRDLGIVAAQHFEPLRHWINWGGNFPAARRLAARMGFALSETDVLDFPSGSMFWARTAALKPLLGLGLSFDSFEAEEGQTDGTLAHAVERLYFHACEHAGLRWIRIAHPPLFTETPAIVTLNGHGDLDRFFAIGGLGLRGPGASAPRRTPVSPAPVAPALVARLQSRALGLGRRIDPATMVAVGIVECGQGEDDLQRVVSAASFALARAGVKGRVLVRTAPGGFAMGHNRIMDEAFDQGADVYIAAAADGVFHPDAIADVLRMTLAHDGRALIGPAPFPAGGQPEGYSAITLEVPAASDACLVISRRLYQRLGGFDASLSAADAAIDLSRRAQACGFTVRICPTALFLQPVVGRDAAAPSAPGSHEFSRLGHGGKRVMDRDADVLDTVVRFHDVRRLTELRRCIFSLIGQSYRPLRIILVLQRFSVAEVAATEAALAAALEADEAPDFTLIPWNGDGPADARAALLNAGVAAAAGRYIAFLDYDDVLYPEAYELLVARLMRTGAAVAFAGLRTVELAVYEKFSRPGADLTPPFAGSGLADLFRHNFCPLHSYVIDRARILPDVLSFVPALTMEEDYDMLLRLCAGHPSDFGLIGIPIGEYYYKTDGSNTVATAGGLTAEARARYLGEIVPAIERRRRSTPVAPAIQRALGLDIREPRSVRQAIDRLGSSS